MSFSIKKFLGITRELPFTDVENDILTQLQANRKVTMAELIPDGMMVEFINTIYSDRKLKAILNRIYSSELIRNRADSRRAFLEDSLRWCLFKNHFGRRLILYHGIDPPNVVKMILKDIDI
jgi:hypothetical protein